MPDDSFALPVLNIVAVGALVVGAFNPEARRYVNQIAISYRDRSKGAIGLLTTAIAAVGHVLITALVGGLAVALGWAIASWNRPVFPVVTAAAFLASGVSEIVKAVYGRWQPSARRQSDDRHGATSNQRVLSTAGALYGFALSPCRAVLVLYFLTVMSGLRGFALLFTCFAAATIAMVLLQMSLVLTNHGNRYFFEKEGACRIIVGVLLCFLSVIVVSLS